MPGLVLVLPGLGSAAGNQAAPPEAQRDALAQGAKTRPEPELASRSLFGVTASPDRGCAAWHPFPSPADWGWLPEALMLGLPCQRP